MEKKTFSCDQTEWTWAYCVGPCCHLHQERNFSSHYSKIRRLLRASFIPVCLVTRSAWPRGPHLCSGTSQPPKVDSKTNKNSLAYWCNDHEKHCHAPNYLALHSFAWHIWNMRANPGISWSRQTKHLQSHQWIQVWRLITITAGFSPPKHTRLVLDEWTVNVPPTTPVLTTQFVVFPSLLVFALRPFLSRGQKCKWGKREKQKFSPTSDWIEDVHRVLTGRDTPVQSPLLEVASCPSSPVTRGAFLWLGAERLFLSPDHCERHEKEITSSQRPRHATRADFSRANPLDTTFWADTWSTGAHLKQSSTAVCELPYCFCDSRARRNGSLKAKKAEGGDTPERLRASSSALLDPPRQQMPAVAPCRLALGGPGHRRQSSEGIRGGYKCQFGPGFPSPYRSAHYSPRLRSLTSAIPLLRKLTIARML